MTPKTPIILARDRVHEPLYAIVPYYNPWRYKSRVKHTERALKHFHDAGATIVLVEIGFNRRDLVFADSGLDGSPSECGILGSDPKFRHKYVGLHTKDELWLKENAIDIGVQNLPYDFQNVCWLDSDVMFVRSNWVGECIHKLQHGTASDVAFVQMFSHAADLGPNHEILPATYPHAQGAGFIQAWKDGTLKSSLTEKIRADLNAIGHDMEKLAEDYMQLEEDLFGNYYGSDSAKRVWPGLAWACTRKAWDAVGGLPDIALWGGGDWHMSHSLIGKKEQLMLPDLHPNYQSMVLEWHDRCERHVRRNVLTMEGSILHNWHGRKVQRGYNSKHQVIAKWKFDPLRMLKRDSQGLYQLHDDGSESYVQLRDTMRKIAKDRNEDSIDV